jgi:hypothetical protein
MMNHEEHKGRKMVKLNNFSFLEYGVVKKGSSIG